MKIPLNLKQIFYHFEDSKGKKGSSSESFSIWKVHQPPGHFSNETDELGYRIFDLNDIFFELDHFVGIFIDSIFEKEMKDIHDFNDKVDVDLNDLFSPHWVRISFLRELFQPIQGCFH